MKKIRKSNLLEIAGPRQNVTGEFEYNANEQYTNISCIHVYIILYNWVTKSLQGLKSNSENVVNPSLIMWFLKYTTSSGPADRVSGRNINNNRIEVYNLKLLTGITIVVIPTCRKQLKYRM